MLKDNPTYPLPEGYKKYYEKEVHFSYKLSDKLLLTEGQRICYDIVNDLFRDALKINLVEPISQITQIPKAQPRITAPVNP